MFEVKILIPLASNDGDTFTQAHHEQFEATAINLFGGLTRYGAAEGSWAENGAIYRDRHLVYAVALASLTDGAKIGDLVAFAKAHYGQLAIYVTYLGQAEIL